MAVQSLDLEPFLSEVVILNACEGDIEEIIKKHLQHPSTLKFMDIVTHDVNKRILDLEVKKASIEILIGNEIVSNYLADIYNNSKNKGNYPSSLKLGAVTPINKKTRPLLKKIIVQ